jgi:hypothetical protein
VKCVKQAFEDILGIQIDLPDPPVRKGYLFEEFYPICLALGWAPMYLPLQANSPDYSPDNIAYTLDSFFFGQLALGINAVIGCYMPATGSYHAMTALGNTASGRHAPIFKDRAKRYGFDEIIILQAILFYPTSKITNSPKGFWAKDEETNENTTIG